MFTGLIEEVGCVASLVRRGQAAVLVVTCGLPAAETRLGDSIAVSGACLTVTAIGAGRFTFDVSAETLARTTFSTLAPGMPVNLERAVRLGDRLGGHLVTGHIDCVATLSGRRDESDNITMSFRLPHEYSRYLVTKGSVTVDGISLTVNSVSADGFTVNIIPHTADMTTLRLRKPGDRVNIETDIIGKYVERLLGTQPADGDEGLTLATLVRNGFV
jgi:riboflavin synthase